MGAHTGRSLIGPNFMQITVWRHWLTNPIKNGPIRKQDEGGSLWLVEKWQVSVNQSQPEKHCVSVSDLVISDTCDHVTQESSFRQRQNWLTVYFHTAAGIIYPSIPLKSTSSMTENVKEKPTEPIIHGMRWRSGVTKEMVDTFPRLVARKNDI